MISRGAVALTDARLAILFLHGKGVVVGGMVFGTIGTAMEDGPLFILCWSWVACRFGYLIVDTNGIVHDKACGFSLRVSD